MTSLLFVAHAFAALATSAPSAPVPTLAAVLLDLQQTSDEPPPSVVPS